MQSYLHLLPGTNTLPFVLPLLVVLERHGSIHIGILSETQSRRAMWTNVRVKRYPALLQPIAQRNFLVPSPREPIASELMPLECGENVPLRVAHLGNRL